MPSTLNFSNKKFEKAVAVLGKESKFGLRIWDDMQSRPLGRLTKRELELCLINAAVDSGLVEAKPAK